MALYSPGRYIRFESGLKTKFHTCVAKQRLCIGGNLINTTLLLLSSQSVISPNEMHDTYDILAARSRVLHILTYKVNSYVLAAQDLC